MLLAQTSGRAGAQELIRKAATRALTERRNFTQVLMETPEISDHISPRELADLENARHYLGSAEEFRKDLLGPSVRARMQRVSSLKKKR